MARSLSLTCSPSRRPTCILRISSTVTPLNFSVEAGSVRFYLSDKIVGRRRETECGTDSMEGFRLRNGLERARGVRHCKKLHRVHL